MNTTPDTAGQFVIAVRAAEEGLLFWNKEDGFVELANATIFDEAETHEPPRLISDTPPKWLRLPSPQPVPRGNGSPSTAQNRARLILLDTIHALMSEYLMDECPDDELWEDFDTDIDRLRSEIGDLHDEETVYLTNLPAQPLRFSVDIEFLSEREPFATEHYDIQAYDWTDAKRAALRQADKSPYDNERIPDLQRRVVDRTEYTPASPG